MKLCGTATFRPSLFAGGSASGGTNGSQPRYMDGVDGWMDGSPQKTWGWSLLSASPELRLLG